jgi:hypothetical protein
LKRVLSPAIAELQKQGFLKELTAEERFVRRAKGEWNAVFVREGKQVVRAAGDEPELAKALIDRGVNPKSARTIVAGTEEGKVREKLALFDWLSAKSDPRIQKNPAGFLYRSIAEDFSLPADYQTASAQKPKAQVRKLVPLQRQTDRKSAGPKPPCDREAIESFWKSLTVEEQGRIEEELVAKAPRFLREQYVDGRQKRGILFQTVRQAMIDEYVRGVLVIPAAQNS